eukprot:gene1307-315_t
MAPSRGVIVLLGAFVAAEIQFLASELRGVENFEVPSLMPEVYDGKYSDYNFQTLDQVPDGIVCNADSLAHFNCVDNEIFNWTQYLYKICQGCWHSGCTRSWRLKPAIIELSLLALHHLDDSFCWTGGVTAVIALLHLSDEYLGAHNDGFLEHQAGQLQLDQAPDVLLPFPFEKRAWYWYSKGYKPLQSFLFCGQEWHNDQREPFTRLVFDATPHEHCYFDAGIQSFMTRCNHRSESNYFYYSNGKRHRSHTDRDPIDWKCPNIFQLQESWVTQKYDSRDCYSPREAMWQFDISDSLRCVAHVIAEKLNFQPGDRVLDWGSGCGHMLTWMHMHWGIEGYGIDATASGVDFSNQHSVGNYCRYGGGDLSWVPDESFDHVVSYWTMYHLETSDAMCLMLGQLIRKVKVGGAVWIGGLCPVPGIRKHCMQPYEWDRCLLALTGKSGMEKFGMPNMTIRNEMQSDHHLFINLEKFHNDPKTKLNESEVEGSNT